MPPHVDLVILFSAGVPLINKAQAKENIQEAEEQYMRLLNLLRTSGLYAVGKRGEKLGDLMILVKCPQEKLDVLARAERFVLHSMMPSEWWLYRVHVGLTSFEFSLNF